MPWRRFLCCIGGLLFLLGAEGGLARGVSSLGRIEPLHGVYELAGPSEIAVVSDLKVEEGDRVTVGQVLARLDTYAVRQAEVHKAEVALEHARRVLQRNERQGSFQSAAALDQAQRDVDVHQADLVAARARLEQSEVRAPVAGQVLAIHARQGERIGAQGLLELGQTDRMFVVAEVYETDIALVSAGQRATAISPALESPILGRVERVGKLIAKNDVLDLDPIARMDSRVVEVFILLDEPERVENLTNLQVHVEFESSP